VAEYLAGLEAEAQVQQGGDSRGSGSDGPPAAAPDRKPPKVISPSDPSSAWTAKANKRVQFGYGLNYLIDVEHPVIVDVEPTPARTYDEVESTKTMLDRTERRFNLKPKRLTERAVSSAGWLAAGLLHIFPFATQASAMTALFRAVTFAGQTARHLHLSKQQSATHHRHRARRQHAPLPRLQIRLRCVRAEDAMLSEYGCPTDTP
jgi:hypothetical protein